MVQTDNNERCVTQMPEQQSVGETELDLLVVEEIGGTNGLEPTRYGDWEKNGRCIDF